MMHPSTTLLMIFMFATSPTIAWKNRLAADHPRKGMEPSSEGSDKEKNFEAKRPPGPPAAAAPTEVRRLFSQRRLTAVTANTWTSPSGGNDKKMKKNDKESWQINNVNNLCYKKSDQKFSGPSQIVFDLYFESSAAMLISPLSTPAEGKNLYWLGKGGQYTIGLKKNHYTKSNCAKRDAFSKVDIIPNPLNFDQEPDRNNGGTGSYDDVSCH